jgi:hypothetical protein
MGFSDRLTLGLTLTIGDKQHEIPGSAVKALALDLHSYGFSGAVEFVVIDDADQGGQEDDELIADFVTADLIVVDLSVKTQFPDPETEQAIEPVRVTGLCTARSVEEIPDRAPDRTLIWRRYRVEIADPARVLWSQHFPVELYTQKSLKDVIIAQQNTRIRVTHEWEALAAPAPQVFLHLRPEDEASFYDFLAWYVDRHAGVWIHDYADRSYRLSAARDASATPEELVGDDVASLRVVYPEVARYQRSVVNTFAGAAAIKPIANERSLDPIRQDYLVRFPIAQHLDDRVALEKSRLVVRSRELEIVFARWPRVTFGPGSLIKFLSENLFAPAALQLTGAFRVFHHRLEARARDPHPEVDRDLSSTSYEIELSARLEQQDETYPRLPSYVQPTYPGHVEGKVVSEQGADADLTYQFYTDEDTSLDHYKISIPVWSDQVITAPYHPGHGSGKVYVPLYKGARVLLEMHLFHAAVARVLDWREGVRLAQDAQGEQIFWGKRATAGTMVNHRYDDDKPVFRIARAHDKDKATIEIKEGVLTLQVKEDT